MVSLGLLVIIVERIFKSKILVYVGESFITSTFLKLIKVLVAF